jgi:hypothetical protein
MRGCEEEGEGMNADSNCNPFQLRDDDIAKVELRSDEIRGIMGGMPRWTSRSGSGYLSILMALIVGISWFIKYPDVMVGRVTGSQGTAAVRLDVRGTSNLARSGRIRREQPVRVRFASYPSEDDVVVYGIIEKIVMMPGQELCSMAIRLPDGLASDGKRVDVRRSVGERVEVITDDVRLLERLSYRLRALRLKK